jgi:sterol 3beta-glucosyltransferase
MMGYRGLAIGEAAGVPSRTLFYFPFPATGDWASILSPVRDLRLRSVNRASAQALHRLLWAQNRVNVDELCEALGRPRYRRRPRLEDQASLGMYPPELAPAPADWQPHHQLVVDGA